ncbi:DUF885 domain-containing protein [Zhihengliuella halotolerans]|uniref:Uncharacterized protein (DUF885 family) n=1 Tax=Zhihengliuella halotolerans TaxID=370736 RepID=A0A4Q8ACX6_9MICC|nr:DUF885 domain-containing protein [Zhihengliuella halotolerans]RZU62028.1 uncharacterized protein (DUF885 family) [Zhihengliuella halotolerans]
MTQSTIEAEARRAPTPIDAVADAYYQRTLALNPDLATILGIPGGEREYGDYSPAGREAQAEAARAVLDSLADLEPADEIDAVTLDAMRERLGLELEIHATGITELNNIASPAQEIRSIFDLMPTVTASDWEHISGRLANVPAALAGYTQSLQTSRDAGLVSARRQVEIVIEQTREYAAEDGYFEQLAQNAQVADGELPAELQVDLTTNARIAAEAYGSFADFLEVELLDAAPVKDAVGRELYALKSRRFLGAAVDLEETYAWGIGELERIIAEQRRAAEQIRPGASIAEAKAILNADPKRQLHGTDALRDWMQARSDAALAAMKDVHFEIPAPMDRLECKIAPTQEGGVYYTGPSDDFSRPGRMWWSVPAGEDSFTTWAETTTVYHEGVPGHHLQIATATRLKDTLNPWRRHLCFTSGHAEGWALYAERLMHQLGFLDDPGDYLGMLDMQRMRAARVVFDIGVHLELAMPEDWDADLMGAGAPGQTWDPEVGFDFLSQHLDLSEGQLKFEFTRYLGWPGQAPSYKIGQRLWEEIRSSREQREGEKFDLRAFHTDALAVGSVGLDTLRRALLE